MLRFHWFVLANLAGLTTYVNLVSDLTRWINILSRVDLTGLIQLGMNGQADGKMDTWVFFGPCRPRLRSHSPDFQVSLIRQEIIIGVFFLLYSYFFLSLGVQSMGMLEQYYARFNLPAYWFIGPSTEAQVWLERLENSKPGTSQLQHYGEWSYVEPTLVSPPIGVLHFDEVWWMVDAIGLERLVQNI